MSYSGFYVRYVQLIIQLHLEGRGFGEIAAAVGALRPYGEQLSTDMVRYILRKEGVLRAAWRRPQAGGEFRDRNAAIWGAVRGGETFAEVAKRHGISRSRVSQVHRQISRAKGLPWRKAEWKAAAVGA